MKGVLVDYRISQKSIDTLKALDYNIIKTIENKNVLPTLCGHPDIVVCKMSEFDYIVETTYRGIFENSLNINIIIGKSILNPTYPYDIAYNSARVGDYLFCNEKYTDIEIIQYCKTNNIKILNTKQGYAKCSICIVSDNAIITSDKNIFNLAEQNKIDVLLTDDRNIKLKGYKNGFIGGTTGLLENNLLAVNGNIKLHTNYKEIKIFCSKHNVEIISLSNEELEDVGSIIKL